VKGAETKKLSLAEVQGFSSSTGKGVKGIVSGKLVAVGNAELFRELGIDPAPLLSRAEERRKEGQTVMLIAADGKAAGHSFAMQHYAPAGLARHLPLLPLLHSNRGTNFVANVVRNLTTNVRYFSATTLQ
jgi:hypothetical protein